MKTPIKDFFIGCLIVVLAAAMVSGGRNRSKYEKDLAAATAERDRAVLAEQNAKVKLTASEDHLTSAKAALEAEGKALSQIADLKITLKETVRAIPRPKTCDDLRLMLNAQLDGIVRVRQHWTQIASPAQTGLPQDPD